MIPAGAHWVRVPRFFGDAMMIHAALAPLRATGAPLVVWGPDWVVDLFEGAEGYAAVVPETGRSYGALEAARMLRPHRPASLIAFPRSVRPILAGFLAGIPRRLGCGDLGVRLLSTHALPFEGSPGTFTDRYRAVFRRAFPDLPEAPFRPFRPRAEALARVAARRAEAGLGDYVAVIPGGNHHLKRIDPAVLAPVAAHFKRKGLGVVLLGSGPHDQVAAKMIQAQVPEALDLTTPRPLSESAAWAVGAKGAFGPDSGLSFLTAAGGVPTLVAFGPTRPEWSTPPGPRVEVVRNPALSCLGCFLDHCPFEPKIPCMQDLDPAHLAARLEALMETAP